MNGIFARVMTMDWMMMSEWQSIDTAPKNGNHILVIDNEGLIDRCFWHQYRDSGCWENFSMDFELLNLTHWMPLPEPPKE